MKTIIPILATLAFLLSSCTGPSIKAPAGVDLTGTWVLVPELSGRPVTLPKADKLDQRFLARLRSDPLRIEQADGLPRFLYDDQFERVCPRGTSEDGTLECGWEDRDFQIVMTIPDVGQLSRKFILTDDGQSLTVVMVMNREAVTLFYRRHGPRSLPEG